MPNDPIDDLLSTPDGTVSPFDPLEANVSQDVASATFRAMRDHCRVRLDQHLAAHGLDGDVVGLRKRRTKLQQAIDALDWVASQPGLSVTLGCYPVDLAAEHEYFEQMLARHPDVADVSEDELFIPRGTDADAFREELERRIRDMQDNPPKDNEDENEA